MQEKTGKNRDEQGKFLPGVSGNPDGRPPDTPARKIEKKAIKEFVREYKERLAEALPLISPVLIAKAQKGNIPAIREINDRVMGRPKDDDDPNKQINVIFTNEQIKRIAKGILDGATGSTEPSDSVRDSDESEIRSELASQDNSG